MYVYDAVCVYSLLKPGFSDNKHELIKVVVPANVTIHKITFNNVRVNNRAKNYAKYQDSKS